MAAHFMGRIVLFLPLPLNRDQPAMTMMPLFISPRPC
jgi:hypothetical protein